MMMNDMQGWGRLTVGMVMGMAVLGLSGCELLLPKDGPSAKAGSGMRLTAGTKKRPFMIVRACYQRSDRLEALATRLGDLPEPTRGLVPMGNGTIEIGFQDASGAWIESLESGGSLAVPGEPGADYELVVRNTSRTPIEVRVRVDGRDLLSGKADAWDHVGAEIEPGAKVVFDQGWKSDGTAYPLTFAAVKGVEAMRDYSPNGRTGLIQVAVFALDREDHMRTAAPVPGWKGEAIPFVPREKPYQYR